MSLLLLARVFDDGTGKSHGADSGPRLDSSRFLDGLVGGGVSGEPTFQSLDSARMLRLMEYGAQGDSIVVVSLHFPRG